MALYVQSQIGACEEFVYDGEKQVVSVVISPLRVIQTGSALKINSKCNLVDGTPATY